jgi:hypothetical protein
MDLARLIVSFDGDGIGRRVGAATLSDDISEVRRVDQAIQRGNAIFSSWALASGGSVIELGGDEGRLEVPAEALKDLPGIRANYGSAVDATVSVGVGRTLSQSAKALLAAKLRGKDRVVLYDQSVEQEVAAAKQPTEAEKIGEEYLGKTAEGSAQSHHLGGVSVPRRQHPSRQTEEHSEGEVAEKQAGGHAETPHTHGPAEDEFHAFATNQETADKAKAARQSEDFQKLKQQVAVALTGLKAQLPVLAQLKQAYPDTYKAVTSLVQSVVVLARGLQATEAGLQKKERAVKVWRENTSGFGAPVTIPSQEHPGRAAWDADYMGRLAATYAKGNVKALKIKDISTGLMDPGNSGRGAVNKDRYSLYRRMLSGGDRVPPVVLRQLPGGRYSILDGTHRYEAAVATKSPHLPAVVVKDELPFEKDSLQPHHSPDPQKHFPAAPVGTLHNGKLKVRHADGHSSWKGVRAGMIQGLEADAPMMGANSHPVSSREPNSK